jgi:hypothetical protein
LEDLERSTEQSGLKAALEFYPSLGLDACLERMFDFSHFGDQVGGFD